MGNCGSPSCYQEAGCHELAVPIGHIRLIQTYVLWGSPEPISAYCDNSLQLYRVFLNVNFIIKSPCLPMPVAARSEAWVCGRSLVGIAGSNSDQAHGYLSVVNIVCYAGRGLCDGPTTRPRESYRVVCVCVCVVECDEVQ